MSIELSELKINLPNGQVQEINFAPEMLAYSPEILIEFPEMALTIQAKFTDQGGTLVAALTRQAVIRMTLPESIPEDLLPAFVSWITSIGGRFEDGVAEFTVGLDLG